MNNYASLLSHLYIKPPAMSPPSMPVLHGQDDTNGPIIDVFGAPFGPGSPLPPIVPGAPSVTSQISLLQHEVMVYNASLQAVVGRDEDMQTRRDYLVRLAALENSFPRRLRYRENLTPQTLFIK